MKTRLEQARSRFLGQTDDKEKKHESYEAQTAARPTAGSSARERFLQNGFGKTMTAERERWGQALDTYRKAAPTISPEDSIARAKRKASTATPGHVEQDALSTPRRAAEAVAELAPVRAGIGQKNAVEQRRHLDGLIHNQTHMDLRVGTSALESSTLSDEKREAGMRAGVWPKTVEQVPQRLVQRDTRLMQALQGLATETPTERDNRILKDLQLQVQNRKKERDQPYETTEQWELRQAAYEAAQQELENQSQRMETVRTALSQKAQQTGDFSDIAAAAETYLATAQAVNGSLTKQDLAELDKLQKSLQDVIQTGSREQADTARRYFEMLNSAYHKGKGKNVGDHIIYTAGQTAVGTASTVQNIGSGLEAGLANGKTKGETAQELPKLSQWVMENPAAIELLELNELGAPAGKGAVAWVAGQAGVSEQTVQSYLAATKNQRLQQRFDQAIGTGVSQGYRDTVGKWAYTIGQQLPGLAMGAGAANGAAGGLIGKLASGEGVKAAAKAALQGNLATYLVGASSAGSKLTQNMLEGQGSAASYINALGTGFMEYFTEGLFGFSDMPSYQAIFEGVTADTTQSIARAFLNYIASGLEEGLEEVVNVPLEGIVNKMTTDRGKRLTGSGGIFDWGQMVQGGLDGAVVGMLMGGVAAVSGIYSAAQQSRDIASGLSQMQQVSQLLPEDLRPAVGPAQQVTQEELDRYTEKVLEGLEQYSQRLQQTDTVEQTLKGPISENTGEHPSGMLENMLTEADLDGYLSTGERKHVRDTKQAQLQQGQSPILTTVEQVKDFIQKALHGQVRDTVKGYGYAPKRLRQAVSAATDGKVDIDGYYMELSANELQHLMKHVQEDADPRNIPLTEEQILSLPEYIQNFDDLVDVIRPKDGRVRLMLGKKINGHSIIIETVSKGRKSLHPVTAYQVPTQRYEQYYRPRAEAAYPASRTAEAAQIPLSTSAPGAFSVAQAGEGVKRGDSGLNQASRQAQDGAERGKNGSGYGDYGAKVFSELVETSGLTQEQVERQFHTAYELGRLDTPVDKVPLETELQRIAYNAGRIDAIKSTATKDAAQAQRTKTYGETAGLVRDDAWKKANLSTKANRTLDALAQTLGVQIRFTDTVQTADGRKANAKYQDGGDHPGPGREGPADDHGAARGGPPHSGGVARGL